MQIFSLAGIGFLAQATPPATAADAASYTSSLQRMFGGDWQWLAILGLSQVIAIISYFLASKAVVDTDLDGEGRPTFGQAIKTWLITTIVFALFYGVLFYVSSRYGQFTTTGARGAKLSSEALVPAIALLGTSLASLVALFAVPMRVYKLGCGGAIGFVIFSVVIQSIGGVGMFFLFQDKFRELSKTVAVAPGARGSNTGTPGATIFQTKSRFVQTVEPLGNTAADKRRPMPERQQAIKDLYSELEKYRATLDVNNNPVGVGEYEKQKARYEQILAELRAEVAAQRAAAPR